LKNGYIYEDIDSHKVGCFGTECIYTVSQKNIPDIFDYNVKKDYRILIIFSTNIPETTYSQVTI